MSDYIEGTREGAQATDLSQSTTQHPTMNYPLIQRLLTIQDILHAQHDQEHNMFGHGARDERTVYYQPDPEVVAAIELKLHYLNKELVTLGYSPCPFPDKFDFLECIRANNKGDAPF